MEKKNIFEKPEAILVNFDKEDIIVTSGPGENCDPDDQWGGLCD